jgi:non-ribosomal peptide synthetase component F
MFNLQNAAPQTLTFDGLALGPAGARVKTAKIELILTITESNQGFLVTMEYSTDLFEAETIERLLDHFKTLLAGIAAHPET